MNAENSSMRPPADRDARDRDNLRLGLILGAVALAIFVAAILRYWLQTK